MIKPIFVKSLPVVLVFVFLLFLSLVSQAAHSFGGELGWKCLSNGQYQFYMSVYRDCSGIPWGFEEEVINIVGSPLPRDATGSIVSSIKLSPDSVRWDAERQGNLAPRCTNRYGDSLNCGSNGDDGVIQEFFYLSTPFTLAGTPPNDGWKFNWTSSCCRSGALENVITNVGGITNTIVLRVEMFPTKNKDDVDPCIDSSPELRALPVSAICRGYEFTYNPTAIDADLDSITYNLSYGINPPIIQPNQVPFKTGYSVNSPTPDTSFDTRNIPLSIDSETGFMKMAVYSGVGVKKYLTVVAASSWRDGVVIAKTYRELPLTVLDCPKMPSGFFNRPPSIKIEGIADQNHKIEVIAGQKISKSIEIKDIDQALPPGQGNSQQLVTLVPDGLMFSRDRKATVPCQIDNGLVDPCAILQKQAPFLDTGEEPAVYKVEGSGGLSTEFVWQTDCKHVQIKSGEAGTRSSIYNFVMRVTDDHCPLPLINYPTISVKVKEPIILDEPIMKGLSVGLDGKLTYQWVPPIDSVNTFEKYHVWYALVQEGFTPNLWGQINNSLKTYHYFKKYNDDPSVYMTVGNIAGNPSNILRKNNGPTGNGFDWYLRMTTVSGCGDTSKSEPSEFVRVIELETKPAGTFPAPLKGGADLSWNRPKPVSAATKPYFKYESHTWFYIWENDSVGKPGEELAETRDSTNWYLRGRTQSTSFNAESNVCGDYVGFRIEARDTVVTFRKGQGLLSDSLDTLVFSTFSTVDTLYQVQAGFIPKPNFDTLEVLDNGDVYVRLDEANAGTIGDFEVYEDAIGGTPLTVLERGIQNSASISGAGATAGTAVDFPGSGKIGSFNTYVMKAIDECDATKTSDGEPFTTISPYGEMSSLCPPTFTLNWNKPEFGEYIISSYKIYQNGKHISTVTDGNITTIDLLVRKAKNYDFKVIATSNRINNIPAVNISATLNYTVPSNLRSDEVVPGPDLRCSFVETNGSVTLTFDHPVDSTNNRTGYEFHYKESSSGIWQTFGGSSLVDTSDLVVNITGINAQQQQYDFRALSLSGCSGTDAGRFGNEVSSLFLTAKSREGDAQKRGDLDWNNDAVSDRYDNIIHKNGEGATDPYAFNPLSTNVVPPFVDNFNWAICDSTFDYYIDKQVDLFSTYPTAPQTCISRSNIATAAYLDTARPGPPNTNHFLDLKDDTTLRATFYHPQDSFIWMKFIGKESGLNQYRVVARTAEPNYTPGDTGHYVLRMEDGCGNLSELSNLVGIFPVSISELPFKDQFSFYPNPTSGIINIVSNKVLWKIRLEVRNIQGQLIQDKQYLNQRNIEFEIKGKAGVYFIQLIDDYGGRTNFKVIKH